jgi:hypothetical protein
VKAGVSAAALQLPGVARVIKLKPWGDRADEGLEGNDVCLPCFAANLDLSVAKLVDPASPM